MFSGAFTALVTPFNNDGSVDYGAFREIVNNQIREGISGLVPVGTTGESPTLSHEENLKVVEETIKLSEGRIPVIAGTGSNCTKEAVEMTQFAKASGATASLQVVPYYNKPTQEGIYRHYMTIADQVDLPIVVYNIIGRSGVNIETDTLLRMAQHPNIVCVKEASGNIGQMMDVINKKPAGFSTLVGDDNLIFPFVCLGGDGVISVISNLLPGTVEKMIRLTKEGKIEEARKIHYELIPLCKGMFMETSPIPVKAALSLMGKIDEVYRLPLCEPMEATREHVKSLLKQYNLI